MNQDQDDFLEETKSIIEFGEALSKLAREFVERHPEKEVLALNVMMKCMIGLSAHLAKLDSNYTEKEFKKFCREVFRSCERHIGEQKLDLKVN